MKAVSVIAIIIASIAVIVALSITYVAIVRLQEHSDKLDDLDLRVNNVAEGGKVTNEQIRELQRRLKYE